MSELLARFLDALKGLTFANVVIIILLALVGLPAYFTWRAIDNPALFSMLFSEFQEVTTDTDCTLIKGQLSGASPYWGLTNQFAARNAESWSIAVRIKFKPDHEAIVAYCQALEGVIDYLRDPELSPPTFPGSTKPIVWREHHPAAGGP